MVSLDVTLVCKYLSNIYSLSTRLLIISAVLQAVECQKAAASSAGEIKDDGGFTTFSDGANQAMALVETALGTIITSPEEAKDAAKDPAKAMENLKENMTIDLSASTGKDWGDLSAAVLGAAWSNSGDKTEVSVLELMKWFENVGGEERLYLLRILELMDRNMNGLVSKYEFTSLYAAPMASPDKAMELLHRISDYDGNGYISVWEALTQILTVDGINRDIFDKYQEAAHLNRIKDTNMDLVVSLHEFINYMVWQMNEAIGRQTD